MTYLQGKRTTQRGGKNGECGIEIIQLQNEFNSLALKRRICEKE